MSGWGILPELSSKEREEEIKKPASTPRLLLAFSLTFLQKKDKLKKWIPYEITGYI